ncbi:hypothetical protein B0H14DRAFT_3506941 [Mycena olivaceomarginata]|nr:hypothetical protein B0H14DRAFT_3506941 [Mycena olivaceomarginata]
MVFRYDWGIQGIDIPVPPSREGMGPFRHPLGWDRLRFGPLGLYDLRRRLGVHPSEPGVFQDYRARFLTADIAWFAGGTSTDNHHTPATGGFFPEFDAMRKSLPTGMVGNEARKALNERVRHAVFDLATLWDRTFGGTTMVLHVDGTTVPGTPAEPQYLRASTYLPPDFVDSHEGSHVAITRIAQLFLEGIGVPTVQQWAANARACDWLLTQPTTHTTPNESSPDLIPTPPVGSAHYKFFGRRVGELERMLVRERTPAPIPIVFIPDNDEDIMDAIKRAAYAEARTTECLEQIHELEQQVDILIARVAAADSLSADLQRNLLMARRAPDPVRSTPPSTPSRSRTHTVARSQSLHPSGPPPYSPSANAWFPIPAASLNPPSTDARYPIPAPSLNPRSPLAAPFHADETRQDGQPDALDSFIVAQNLQSLVVSIRLVIRGFSAAKWYEELLRLNIPGPVVSRLIDAAVSLTAHRT